MVELTNAIVSAAVSAVVGGGVVKVWAGKFLERDRARNGEAIAQFRGDLEAANRRIQAELDRIVHVHRVQFETEFQALRDIWGKVAEVRTSMQVLRPELSFGHVSADPEADRKRREKEFGDRLKVFTEAHNQLLDAVREQEPFYPENVHGELVAIVSISGREVKHIDLHSDSEPGWYEVGQQNYEALEGRAKALSKLIRDRIKQLAVYK